jgi:hypothetical protein
MSEAGNWVAEGDCKRDEDSDAVAGEMMLSPSGVLNTADWCFRLTTDAASLSFVGDGGTGSLETVALIRLYRPLNPPGTRSAPNALASLPLGGLGGEPKSKVVSVSVLEAAVWIFCSVWATTAWSSSFDEACEFREVRRESLGAWGAEEDERLGEEASRALLPGATWDAMACKLSKGRS